MSLLADRHGIAPQAWLHDARDPLYRETAHEVIDTRRPSIAILVNSLVMQLELAGIVAASTPPAERSD